MKTMSTIEIRKTSITSLETDAIVNAANEDLWAGGGVCGAIFRAAGYEQLQESCSRIGHCDTGSAVITPGFHLKARYIIHAVGPRWAGGMHGEPEQLYGAYFRSLELAVENQCRSVGFPLISAGIFGYPVHGAWAQAIQACRDFLDQHSDISLDIVFAVLDDKIIEIGRRALQESDTSCPGIPDKLVIAGKKVDAVFFHKPEEPCGYLSNWYPSPFDLDGIRFSSAEQYIMYRKCMLFGDEPAAKAVLATDDPEKQQAIGRNASGYMEPVWAGARQMAAFRAVMAKFSQNHNLKQKLLDTGDAYLVECAGSDRVWACGIRLADDRRYNAANWTGSNILGFLLMEVRKLLKETEE